METEDKTGLRVFLLAFHPAKGHLPHKHTPISRASCNILTIWTKGERKGGEGREGEGRGERGKGGERGGREGREGEGKGGCACTTHAHISTYTHAHIHILISS